MTVHIAFSDAGAEPAASTMRGRPSFDEEVKVNPRRCVGDHADGANHKRDSKRVRSSDGCLNRSLGRAVGEAGNRTGQPDPLFVNQGLSMFEGNQWLLQEHGVTNGLREEIVVTITRCFAYGHHTEAKDEHGNLFTRQFGSRWVGGGRDGGKEWNAIRQVGVKNEEVESG